MTCALKLICWGVLFVCMAVSLLLLNGAVFRGWAASGPPNDNPAGWLFSAWSYLAWSGSAFFAGVGFFVLLRLPRPTKLAIAALVIGGLLAALPWICELIAQDTCLDFGGSWSTQALRCIHGPTEA